MSLASPSPSPSPTPPLAAHQSSGGGGGAKDPPGPPAQPSTKPGALVSAAKSLLSEQSARLALKHTTDLDLLDDLRLYLKNRCNLERDYTQSLVKLNATHSKRSSTLLTYMCAEDETANVK